MSSAALEVLSIHPKIKTEESPIIIDSHADAIKIKLEPSEYANNATRALEQSVKRKSKHAHGLRRQSENLRRAPPRNASYRARIGVSKAYEPLLIPASLELGTATSSPSILDDSDVEMLLNIDDLIDDVETSDDSDGYMESGATGGARRSRSGHLGKRKNLHAQGASESSLSEKRSKRVPRLDRADLLLIRKDDPEARKAARRRRLCMLSAEERGGLERKHIQSLVNFIAESVDWRHVVERIRCRQAKGDLAQEGLSLSAEVINKHWRDILSKRIVEMYPA